MLKQSHRSLLSPDLNTHTFFQKSQKNHKEFQPLPFCQALSATFNHNFDIQHATSLQSYTYVLKYILKKS